MRILRENKNRNGFTLVELMVVTMFLSVIGIYTWTYLKTTLKTQKAIEEKTQIQQAGISILTRLTDDITQTFIVDSFQKLTLFKGEPEQLTFTALSHDAPDPNDRESEEAKITYALDSDPDSKKNQTKVLTRKEVPYFTPITEQDPDYKPMIVAHGIKELRFSYSQDGLKFVDEWDTTGADHPNKLPLLVKIYFTIVDENDREEYFETLIDLPITEDVNTQTAKSGLPGSNPSGTPGSSGSSSNSGSGTGTQNRGTSNPVTSGSRSQGGSGGSPPKID